MTKSVNLQKSYSALNEHLAKQFDEAGVRRSFTVPYVDGQDTAVHIQSVGQAASQSGGMANNLITSSHHSSGKGYGSGDGHTVGHPTHGLRNTVIPKDDEHAKDTIASAQKYLNDVASLVGDDNPSVKTANSQLALVKKTEGAGMNLFDFGVMMLQIMHAPTQEIARAHSGAKAGGHAPQLRSPGSAQSQEPTEAQGQEEKPQEQGAPAPEEAQTAPSASGSAPTAPESAPAAPAAPGAQG